VGSARLFRNIPEKAPQRCALPAQDFVFAIIFVILFLKFLCGLPDNVAKLPSRHRIARAGLGLTVP
jgi:hypothetical protein